jgi:hypothetical protein
MLLNKILPLVMALLQGIKSLFGPLLMTWTADSPTHRYGESIFDYEYLHEFEFES